MKEYKNLLSSALYVIIVQRLASQETKIISLNKINLSPQKEQM